MKLPSHSPTSWELISEQKANMFFSLSSPLPLELNVEPHSLPFPRLTTLTKVQEQCAHYRRSIFPERRAGKAISQYTEKVKESFENLRRHDENNHICLKGLRCNTEGKASKP